MICFFFVRRGDMLRVEVRQGLAEMGTRLQEERWVPAGLPIEIRDADAPPPRKRVWQRAAAAMRKMLRSMSVAYSL
jgi:hypothetical protein